jgi:hypothetical protein
VIAQRTLAILAAILLVGSVALATLGSGAISLGRALLQLDRDLPEGMHAWMERSVGPWAWNDLCLPLLIRPAWLLPASLGLICLGLSLSLSNRKSAHRSHRRS